MDTQLQNHDDFTIFTSDSVHLLKGGEDKRLIGGYCSTERLDRQGEIVLQKGLDFSEFVQHGYFNDNHSSATGAVVGVPHSAEYQTPRGWFAKGELLKGFPRAEEIYALAKSLEETERSLGFSIEGKVLERRQGFKIAKAKVRHVAITNSPVNVDCTWGMLTKSFCENPLSPEDECPCCVKSAAGLHVGHDIVPTDGGRVLVPQDLETGEIRHLFACPNCEKKFGKGIHLDTHLNDQHDNLKHTPSQAVRRTAKALTQTEATQYLRDITGWNENLCRRVVDYAVAQSTAH